MILSKVKQLMVNRSPCNKCMGADAFWDHLIMIKGEVGRRYSIPFFLHYLLLDAKHQEERTLSVLGS